MLREDYEMVIAGAGSGKTTTMSAKVKYLVEKRQIDPTQIIMISYTNEAIKELKTRINDEFKISTLLPDVEFFKADYGLEADTKFKTQSVSEILSYFDREKY